MWWALIEEIAPHAEEMACEKEVVCCVYTTICGQQQLGKYFCVAGSQLTNVREIFGVKLYSHKKFSYVFCV